MIAFTTNPSTLCLSCAAFLDEPTEGGVCCPFCGFQLNSRDYEILVRYGADAAEYGYHYRSVFEEDLKDDDLGAQYALMIDEAWGFIALAAASGVIGNLATDALKALIRKLRQALEDRQAASCSKPNQRQDHDGLAVLDDEAELERFIRYISDYCYGLEGVDPRVIPHILEEMRAGTRTRALCQLGRYSQANGAAFPPKETLQAEIDRQRELRAAARELGEHAFAGLWQALKDHADSRAADQERTAPPPLQPGQNQGRDTRPKKRKSRKR